MELEKLKENYLPNAIPDQGPQLHRISDVLGKIDETLAAPQREARVA